ncbi:DNA starvation/stationary phase protection protein [Donghicola sp. C2-DW-16]|uniref:DNA starvation/stationary phase protection protein n=1 Tax=Donghicola mangrovi TaxID=2729614 RepID=A0A850Q6P7_9RHOB|nr:DNA starvation/stationary phase protection protein [Donghicola mangrovi]NVO24604.1 DNA starvation/stationary phase protection protein [Donghicola mangrovi]NVO28833.1 DNA starvation/stationary phase protection protein [Donghicola mangrovi]
MKDILQTTPQTQDVNTGVTEPASVATGLADVLADTYCLLYKTHAYHWNVEGPLFYSIHHLTEEQYENLFEAADELAERMRALGALAPMTLSEIVERSVIKDAEGTPDARAMIEELAKDHERIAYRMHALVELAGKANDPVTDDMATARSAFHEKAAWMLRAIASE